jgi:hypothetical protein
MQIRLTLKPRLSLLTPLVVSLHLALQVLHVGDRFSDTGNDTATRDCCSIVWVANPEETGFFVKMLLKVSRFGLLFAVCSVPCILFPVKMLFKVSFCTLCCLAGLLPASS